MVSSATLYGEIGIVLAAIFVILIGLYLLNRYMKRRGPELALREGRAILDDRSHNQIRLGRSAAERLSREGIDVSEATHLLDRAEVARKAGNLEMSIDLAGKAKDSLAAARSANGPIGSASSSMASSRPATAGPAAAAGSAAAAAPAAPSILAGAEPELSNGPVSAASVDAPVNRPPRNKMEAHFQLSLVQDELEKARPEKGRTKVYKDADSLRAQAQSAYDAQDFTEALRLALKSRRTLGTRVESFPVSAAAPAAAPLTAEPGTAASQPTFGQKCPKCGRVAAANDQFCRACGAPIAPAVCAACGAPLLSGDRFCGKCGAVQT